LKFLSDECCDAGIVASLRDFGHDVTYVIEQKTGSSDDEILTMAYNQQRILLTEDKDFGELVYRLRLPSVQTEKLYIDLCVYNRPFDEDSKKS
jgi:predicted nuclease of predicted toxin-antitoxin system